MNLFKFSSLSFFVLCLLIVATPAFGAPTTTKALAKDPVVTGTATLIASVNIREAKIISQDGNAFNISFNITNGEKAQAGVKYGVRLVSVTTKSQVVADEYVYPEVLSLSANSTTQKKITYVAPANLNGDYSILIQAKNNSGLGLGSIMAGKVKLTSTVNNISIIPESCSTSIVGDKSNKTYLLNQGVAIAPSGQIKLNCSVLNSSKTVISAMPVYETHLSSIYGDTVETSGGDVLPVLFKAGEKKTVSLILPKALNPQVYEVKVYLKSGDVLSNSVIAHYLIKGNSATIVNFSLDKDFYKKGETAKLSLVTISSVANNISLSAVITDDKQKECINPVSQEINKSGPIDIPALVIAKCNNPIATVTLKDKDGNTLDQKVLSFESTKESNTFSSKNIIIIVIFGILIVAGIAVYIINLKRKQHEAITQ